MLNTVVFLVDMAMQLIVFLVNYKGHPFMQSIRENKMLFYGLVVSCCFYLVLAMEIIPPFNRYMQLVAFPSWKVRLRCSRDAYLKFLFNVLVVCDLGYCWLVGRCLQWLEKKVNEKREKTQ